MLEFGMKKVGERYKELREKKSTIKEVFTLEKLSKELGIVSPQISRIENNKKYPSLNELVRYSDYFGVSIEYLLGKSTCKKFEYMALENNLGLSQKTLERLKHMNEHKTKNYTQVINCIFDSGLDEEFWILLFHYFFDRIEYKLPREKASTLKNMCAVQIFVNEVDKVSYYLPEEDIDSIHKIAMINILDKIKDKIWANGYRADKITEYGNYSISFHPELAEKETKPNLKRMFKNKAKGSKPKKKSRRGVKKITSTPFIEPYRTILFS